VVATGVSSDVEQRRVERLAAIGQMVAGFAHEIRNPLAAMQALAEALLGEIEEGDPRREYAYRLLALLGRIDRFVRMSLEFGSPPPPSPARHDPRRLVATAIAAIPSGEPPRLRIADDAPLVLVDATQLVESLVALLENAVDAAGGTGPVEVSLSRVDGDLLGREHRFAARIDVRDHGPGIPEDQLSRIFDPFYTTKPKGRGLGLAIAQTLVRGNGGRLLVRSTPGVETVFSVVLPEAAE
jgi:signal transduction histidine kinase